VTEPPSGAPAPVTAELRDGEELDLRALAHEICRRYRYEFPDEQARYGDAGIAWCVHDNQHLLNWAVAESNGYGGFERQLTWLAGVLEARDFPLERLARNLDIGQPSWMSWERVSPRPPRSSRMVRAWSGLEHLDHEWTPSHVLMLRVPHYRFAREKERRPRSREGRSAGATRDPGVARGAGGSILRLFDPPGAVPAARSDSGPRPRQRTRRGGGRVRAARRSGVRAPR
jgi:hypothetical protein